MPEHIARIETMMELHVMVIRQPRHSKLIDLTPNRTSRELYLDHEKK